MRVFMNDEEKLNFLTEDWVKEIISQVTDKDSPLLENSEVSKIFNTTQNHLKKTKFEYLKEELAKNEYGEEVEPYLRSQGLPCVKLSGATDKTYIKEILAIQFKMNQDLSERVLKVDEASLSDYVYYSITAHFLCTMV